MRSSNLIESFRYAIAGLVHGFRSERNLRIHGFIGLLVMIFAMSLGVTRGEIALLIVVIGVVLAAELMNTAVERVVDLVTEDYHPLAALAKNLAAGAVLVVAVAAVLVGGVIFGPYLWEQPADTAQGAIQGNLALILMGIVFVVLLVVSIKAAAGSKVLLRGGMPSGHVALAAGLSTATYYVGASGAALLLSVGLVLLVAQSRLEAGIHSLQEVLLGGVIGVVVTVLVFEFMGA